MNWKINYWTFIAFFLGGSLLFNVMRPQPEKKAKWKKEITNIDNNVDKVLNLLEAKADCPSTPDTISAKEAIGRILPYMTEMMAIKNEENMKLPVNFGLGYMKLPKCETLKMFEKVPDGNAYIYLTLEDDPKDDKKKMISAVIGVTNIFDENGQPDITSASKSSFFDFISPCPPICQK